MTEDSLLMLLLTGFMEKKTNILILTFITWAMFIVDQLVSTFFVNIISFFMPYGGNTFAWEALIRYFRDALLFPPDPINNLKLKNSVTV